ncbi:MAG: FAD-dependent oxidoreductase [Verrucomicrobiales bacterium]|nr:FAD-dependent oxidoreductase [Verrucomicrobiales bacterium]
MSSAPSAAIKIGSVVVLGAGSAGLMAALTLKRRLPHLAVQVVRSSEIGVIGVGEGTTAVFPRHFFEYLKLKPQSFYAEADPTWKLGIRFLWGPRPHFFYTFAFEFEKRQPELTRNNGFYYTDEFPWLGPASAHMAQARAFPRRPGGLPQFHNNHAFHIENRKLVAWLERQCTEAGVRITEATVRPERGPDGIAALIAESGERFTADLYVDASGFRSELLGRALEVPFLSYQDTLFCDRAVIGGWDRTTEPILPYTIAETMDAGWAWQIEHEHFINRGYVYSSAFLSDDDARAELLRKNPCIPADRTRVVGFRAGRYQKLWSGNVVAIGNAAGFVEPLEATALQVICVETSSLADSLADSLCEPTPTLIELYNRYNTAAWDDIRDFLAVHYRFNTRLDTPFWRAARNDVAMHAAAEVVEFYRQNGPSVVAGPALIHPSNSFGMDGYLAMLIGQNVPHAKPWNAPESERNFWNQRCRKLAADAQQGMTVSEALKALRSPNLKWA